jgi:pimeloyl-ACP methyl ester carboxylesterase
MIMTHGILGSKRNWRTPANLVSKRVPGIKVITLDHRGHGHSHDLAGANTVASCARDLESTIDSEVRACGDTPDILCGHSFGGKVVLKLLQNRQERGESLPEHTWILDSLPSEYDDTGVSTNPRESVINIFDTVRGISPPFPTAEYAVQELMKQGVSLPIAQWLTINLREHKDHKGAFTWGFDIDVATELFEDFIALDMWHAVHAFDGRGKAHGGRDAHLHFVRAGKNPLWSMGNQLERFDQVTRSNSLVRLHTMPHVGHWLHVEDVQGLVALLTSSESGQQ